MGFSDPGQLTVTMWYHPLLECVQDVFWMLASQDSTPGASSLSFSQTNVHAQLKISDAFAPEKRELEALANPYTMRAPFFTE